jgi:hypothetical protein
MEHGSKEHCQALAQRFAEAAEQTGFPEMRRRLVKLAALYEQMAAVRDAGGAAAEALG